MYSQLYFLLAAILFISAPAAGQQTPGPPQSEAITIQGATAHIGTGEIIENSWIQFEAGEITYVGTAKDANPAGQIIKAEGQHVYPGFIAPNTTLGLVEIDAVKASDDKSELGQILPHVRSLIAYNAESQVVESMRPNGVLTAQICPRGGRVSGRSSIVQLDAWNWEDAAIVADDGLHLNWPGNFSRKRWWAGEGRGYKVNKKYKEQTREIDELFKKAAKYQPSPAGETDLRYEAMQDIFTGKTGLFVHVQEEKEILDVVRFKEKHQISRLIIVGAYEAYKVADQLEDADIPVLLRRVHSTPRRVDEDYDLPYKNAALLHEAGVLVALEGSGRMERMNTRNLPFYAGTAAGYGLDRETALQMITLNTARILGIEEQLGSLEVGKDATLFISAGDALDMQGNRLSHAFIQGRNISLETHQTELYQRYQNKYDRQ
jgi:imidazolonepropionase-like amidohydrolase